VNQGWFQGLGPPVPVIQRPPPPRTPRSQQSATSSSDGEGSHTSTVGTLDSHGIPQVHGARDFRPVRTVQAPEPGVSTTIERVYAAGTDPLSVLQHSSYSRSLCTSTTSSETSSRSHGFPVPWGSGTRPFCELGTPTKNHWNACFVAEIQGNKLNGTWAVVRASLTTLKSESDTACYPPATPVISIQSAPTPQMPFGAEFPPQTRCCECMKWGHVFPACQAICVWCGEKGHIDYCPYQNQIEESMAIDEALDKERQTNRCHKCLKTGHRAVNCLADRVCTNCLGSPRPASAPRPLDLLTTPSRFERMSPCGLLNAVLCSRMGIAM
jgi:hypothetical protein